ncbi:MAG TPA: hypothetical protein VFT12_01020 [Thermoanaerobaculia bacterium]|nr:hypothetical protein [Thermoanaerobaculia bacterium]
MKRLLAVAAVCLLALPLAAEEKGTEKDKKAVKPAEESPLVAAAKSGKRGKGKSIVITDETVRNSKGHVTSTTIEYMPAVPEKEERPAEVVHNEKRAQEKADAAKKAADEKAAAEKKQRDLERRARMADAAENYEDGYDEAGADPAQLEQEMAAAAKEEQKKP